MRVEIFVKIRQFSYFKKILNRPLFIRHRTLAKFLTSLDIVLLPIDGIECHTCYMIGSYFHSSPFPYTIGDSNLQYLVFLQCITFFQGVGSNEAL